MPNLKFTPNLKTVNDIRRTIVYLEDPDHPNHKGYTVDECTTLMDGSPVDGFSESCHLSKERYNFVRPVVEQVKTTGIWLIARFADDAFLNPNEEFFYQAGLINAFAPDRKVFGVWHRNILSGASDFNALVGVVTDEQVPSLRHHRDDPLIARLRRCSDHLVKKLNEIRSASGEGRRIEEMPPYKSRGSAELVTRLVEAAEALKCPPTLKHLDTLLSYAGYISELWRIDFRMNIIVAAPRYQRRTVDIRMPVMDLLSAIELNLNKRNRRKKSLHSRTSISAGVIHALASSTNVIQPSSTSDYNETGTAHSL